LVRERLSDERRKMIDALVSAGRAIPEALANRFLSQSDRTQTPTATTGIVMQPAGLARLSAVAKQAFVTQQATPAQAAITRRPPRRTGEHAVAVTATAQQPAVPREEDEPTRIAPPAAAVRDEAQLSMPASAADSAPIHAPPTELEPARVNNERASELVLRPMKPSLLPVWLVLAVLVTALLGFALTHR